MNKKGFKDLRVEEFKGKTQKKREDGRRKIKAMTNDGLKRKRA